MRKTVLLLVTAAVAMLAGGVALLGAEQPAEASFPGKNGKIAFSSNRDGTREIYTVEEDGANPTRLTHQGGGSPAWSADGTKIAFVRDATIHTMNADGSGVANLRTYGSAPAWSPDGGKIAYMVYGGDEPGIHVMNADGSG